MKKGDPYMDFRTKMDPLYNIPGRCSSVEGFYDATEHRVIFHLIPSPEVNCVDIYRRAEHHHAPKPFWVNTGNTIRFIRPGSVLYDAHYEREGPEVLYYEAVFGITVGRTWRSRSDIAYFRVEVP